MQLMELAILNGTYRDANVKTRKSDIITWAWPRAGGREREREQRPVQEATVSRPTMSLYLLLKASVCPSLSSPLSIVCFMCVSVYVFVCVCSISIG